MTQEPTPRRPQDDEFDISLLDNHDSAKPKVEEEALLSPEEREQLKRATEKTTQALAQGAAVAGEQTKKALSKATDIGKSALAKVGQAMAEKQKAWQDAQAKRREAEAAAQVPSPEPRPDPTPSQEPVSLAEPQAAKSPETPTSDVVAPVTQETPEWQKRWTHPTTEVTPAPVESETPAPSSNGKLFGWFGLAVGALAILIALYVVMNSAPETKNGPVLIDNTGVSVAAEDSASTAPKEEVPVVPPPPVAAEVPTPVAAEQRPVEAPKMVTPKAEVGKPRVVAERRGSLIKVEPTENADPETAQQEAEMEAWFKKLEEQGSERP